MKALTIPNSIDVLPHSFGFADDFLFIDSNIWTNEGSVAVSGVRGGEAEIDTGTTNEDPAGLVSIAAFDLRDDKPIQAIVYAKFAEAGSNTANFWLGFTDQTTIDAQVQDAGAGLPSDFHGAGLYALDGSGTLGVATSVGTDQDLNMMTANNANNISKTLIDVSSSSWRTWFIDIRGDGDSFLKANFALDGTIIASRTIDPDASPTLMSFAMGLKTGAAVEETLLVDYCSVVQAR